MFAGLEAYCMFIGYSRSGHTLVGSLLDAHPEGIIAHELDALRFVDAGVTREELFTALVHQSRRFLAGGRSWSGYRYLVPTGWHGRAERLRVLGDKKGGRSTLRLYERPELLSQLRELVDLPLRIVHVVRNPWDMVATAYRRRRRGDLTIGSCAQTFLTACRANAAIRAELAPQEIIDLRHEDVVADPAASLRALCAFLGLDASDEYARACAEIVHPEPHESRFEVEWSRAALAVVADAVQEYPFLRSYRFGSSVLRPA